MTEQTFTLFDTFSPPHGCLLQSVCMYMCRYHPPPKEQCVIDIITQTEVAQRNLRQILNLVNHRDLNNEIAHNCTQSQLKIRCEQFF